MKTILILLLCTSTTNSLCIFNSTNSELPSTWSYSTVDQVKLCFENISINNSTINETMKQLFNSLDFYSFLSLIRQSNAPYYTNINLREQLFSILNQSYMNMYKNDYDFHQNLVLCFKKLKDYHTKYFAPNGYAQFHLLLPFIFEYVPLKKQIQIKFEHQLYFSIVKTNQNMNYINETITKIDDINAFDYIKNFAEQYSLISKDPIVRLNSVFREEFWLRNLAEYPLPLKNSITFTFSNQNKTITFPYVIIITKKYNKQIDIENDNQFSSTTKSPNRTVFNYINNYEKLNWYEQKIKNNFNFIMGNNDTFYYIHKLTNTSIIRLGSFNDDIAEDIKNILLASTNEKILIIDVIGNHGGHSCLAYGVLNYLVPEYSSLSRLYEPMDGRTTTSLFLFAKIFNLFPNSILDLRNFSSFTNMEWIKPYINYTRGNVTDEYSMKWSINCDGLIFGQGKYWMRNKNNANYFKSIYVLTDGTCGSACSLFLSKLKYASNIKIIYGIGGGYSNDDDNDDNLFESSSYAGGGAFNWNDIVTYSNQMNNNNLSINYLPTSAYFNLNIFEIYINELNKNYPREYLKQSIDKILNNGDYFNLDQTFEKIINDNNQSNGNQFTSKHIFKINIFYILLITFFMN